MPQIGRFLTVASTDNSVPLWLLLVQTGMRRGEVLSVRWQDIDLDKRQLRVRQCIEEINGKVHLTPPKTAAALRTMTLFPESVAALRPTATGRHSVVKRRVTHGAIATSSSPARRAGRSRPRMRSAISTSIIAKANKDAETDDDRLPRFHIHDLSHTHATHLLMDGWDVARVARRLGHANPAITLKLYAHAITDVQGDDLATPAAFRYTRPA